MMKYSRLMSATLNSDSADFLAPDLEFHFSRMVHEYAITPVRNVERDTLVGLFTARAAIAVPNTDGLAFEDDTLIGFPS